MISERLKKVITAQLGLDGDIAMEDSTTADTIPGWDSLSHARILTAVEAEFGISFRSLEILRLKNIGELQKLVDRKLGAA